MKKLTILMMLLIAVAMSGSTVHADLNNGNNHIGFMYVQNRNTEGGDQYNRLSFAIVDEENNNIPENLLSEDIIDSVQLIDPNGQEVTLYDPYFEELKDGFKGYDCNVGQWNYWEPLLSEVGYYIAKIVEPLIVGDYHLIVTVQPDQQIEKYYTFNQQVDLPVVPAKSFKTKFDKNDNLIWRWKVPDEMFELDPTLDTALVAMIDLYKNESAPDNLWVKVPTHMEILFVPKDIIEELIAEYDYLELSIQVRTLDHNNRTFSKSKKLNDCLDDGKIGLEEAIHALQVVSGVRAE